MSKLMSATQKLSFYVLILILVLNPLAGLVGIINLKIEAAAPPQPEDGLLLLAVGERSSVLAETDGNDTTTHNGSEWYYSWGSFGFADEGDSVNLSSADISDDNGDYRLSWHRDEDEMYGGYRLGQIGRAIIDLNDNYDYFRFIYEADTLPEYYPSGPQTNVPFTSLTGWSLCYSGEYGASVELSQLWSDCDGDYLLFGGGGAVFNTIDVKVSGNSILTAPGGSQNAEDKIYSGDTLGLSLYESDGTTPYEWDDFIIYASKCFTYDCSIDVPHFYGENWEEDSQFDWDAGTVVTDGSFTIPEGSQYKYLAIYSADDETGEPDTTNWVRLAVSKVMEDIYVSDCDQLEAVGYDYLEDNIFLSQTIECGTKEDFDPIGDESNKFSGVFDGQGYSINNLNIDSDDDYVGLFSVIDVGAQVKNVDLNNVNVVGYYCVGALAGHLSGTVQNVNVTGSVNGDDSVGGLVGCHADEVGGGSSSPLVFTWNGEEYEYLADVGKSLPRNTNGEDNAQINSDQLVEKDGKYSIKISEEYNEIVYYDDVALITFDHAPGYRVLNSSVRNKNGTFYTVSENPSHPLQSCTDQYENDCLEDLQSSDNSWSYEDESNINSWVVNFGDLSNSPRILLLVQAAMDYSIGLSGVRYVQVKNADGNWVDAYNSSQLTMNGSPLTEVIDMTGKFLTDDYSVKIGYSSTRVNYLAVDTSEQIEFEQNTYQPSYADLEFRGYTAIDKEFYWNHDYENVSEKPEEPFADQTGWFTKYGEITPLLQATDNQYVVMHHGDHMNIEFPYVAPADGLDRSFVLYNWVTFKHANLGLIGRTTNPLPFIGMSSYPYPSNESYPMTPANINYLRTWNTRYVAGNLHTGGSTILDSHTDVDVFGYCLAGGLVGYNDKLIKGSSAIGNVTIDDCDGAGGLVGNNDENGAIIDSYSTGTVTAPYSCDVGGFVGWNGGYIEYSYSTGDVLEVDCDSGGFVGDNSNSAGIYYSYSTGNVTAGGSGANWLGGFIGYSYNIGDIHRSYSTGNVFAGNGYCVGGFVGCGGGGTITESYSLGNVEGNNEVGGFIGIAYDNLAIFDSFARGSVIASTSNHVGGFAGEYGSGEVDRVYSSGSVTGTDSSEYIGAFIGALNESVAVNNSFYDSTNNTQEPVCGSTDCTDEVLGKSTAQMKALATFTTELGGDSWDFEDIWGLSDNINAGYPYFIHTQLFDLDGDGISSEEEHGAPNNGDGNGDGISDADQDNVTSFLNPVSGQYTTLEVNGSLGDCWIISIGAISESSNAVADSGFNYPAGLLNYTAECEEQGDEVEILIYEYGVNVGDVSDFILKKYNSDNNSYSTIPSYEVSIKDINRTLSVVLGAYSVTDGGSLDMDGEVDGFIVDPVGFAILNVGVPNTGLGGLSR